MLTSLCPYPPQTHNTRRSTVLSVSFAADDAALPSSGTGVEGGAGDGNYTPGAMGTAGAGAGAGAGMGTNSPGGPEATPAESRGRRTKRLMVKLRAVRLWMPGALSGLGVGSTGETVPRRRRHSADARERDRTGDPKGREAGWQSKLCVCRWLVMSVCAWGGGGDFQLCAVVGKGAGEWTRGGCGGLEGD